MQNIQTNAQEAHRPALSSPCEVITMLNELKNKHENKEQGKTEHEMPCSKNHKATQNKKNNRTTTFEQSVA